MCVSPLFEVFSELTREIMVGEAELDSFLGQPVVSAGDNNQLNQDQHLDKKHVTKCGLFKARSPTIHLSLQFRSIRFFSALPL